MIIFDSFSESESSSTACHPYISTFIFKPRYLSHSHMSPSCTEPCQEILFQLPVAVTLASSALLSQAVRALSASKRGKIALPVTLNDPLEPQHDPFDVTSPEDIVDGEPVDETSFWLNVRSLIRPLAYPIRLFFLRRRSAGHFWSSPLSLLRLYRPPPWVMPLRFRPQRPQLHTCFMCCLQFISRLSRFSYWEKTRFIRISRTHYSPLRPYNTLICAVGIYRTSPS